MNPSCLAEAFSVQLQRTPDRVAVSDGTLRLSYRELDERSNRLAHRLLALGTSPETPVALLMQRSAGLIVAVLAVVKTGAFYLPLHNEHPDARLLSILQLAGRPLLLTDAALASRAARLQTQVVDISEDVGADSSDPGIISHPDQLAYTMYTSGSTGEPKGVAFTHRAVLSLVSDRSWDGGAHSRVLMVAPHAFGASTYEIWVPLLRGGQIVVAPPRELIVNELASLLADNGITGLHLTAGLFRVVAEEAPHCLAGVREVLTGGDVINPAAVVRVLRACPETVVRALYGSTESLFVSTFAMRCPADVPQEHVPAGTLMDHLAAYVLDENLRPVPAGASGELYVCGQRLGRGYLGRPDLTAERFIANPFGGPGEVMYRTGDIVRQQPDGLLDFVGRAADQVKIRGFRVEPGEIEQALCRVRGVTGAAVLATEAPSGERQLVAYVVAEPGAVEIADLRAEAVDRLPDYMVPAAFVILQSWPLTANGKLDRRALPAPETTTTTPYRPPSNQRQQVLCAIFAEVLGLEQIGIEDDFFDLGGQSLLATRLLSRIRTALEIEVSFNTLFDAPTVADLDRRLAS